MMKIALLLLSVASAIVARPSHGHAVQYAQDGRSYTYSYQTPSFLQPYAQTYVQPQYVQPQYVPRAHFVQAVPVAQQIVPAVYSYGGLAAHTKYIEPANIQVSSDGFVLDTPEVARARAEHLASFAQEAARVGASSDDSETEEISSDNNGEYEHPLAAVQNAQPQEQANIQVSADGHVIDTAEVAQARAEHLAKYAQEAARVSNFHVAYTPNVATYNFAQPIVVAEAYQAPKAVQVSDIKVSADGHVLDTPEVAQAKAQHFAQYAEDAARAIAAGGDTQDYSDESGSSGAVSSGVSVFAVSGSPASVATYKVDDAPADIKVSADGFVLDTPEVAQAKSAHLASLAQAEAAGSSSGDEETGEYKATIPSYVAYTSPSIAYTSNPVAYSAVGYTQPKWTGPEADIKVGADGFVLDTPEVQQARAEHLFTRSSVMAAAQSAASGWSGASSRYAAATASTGQYIADTPEVASAKAAHLAVHAQESARNTQSYGQLVYSAPIVRAFAPHFGYSFASAPYNFLSFRYAPTAAPVALTPDGQYLLDTPEVAAAKSAHFAAYNKALSH